MTNSKGPSFTPHLPPEEHIVPNYFTIYERARIFHIYSALKPPVKGNKNMNYCLEPKPWSLHRWGGTPAVYMSHHPTRLKRERKSSTGMQTHAFEQGESSSRFDFHSTVRLYSAAAKTTCNESEARGGIQRGMHREIRGIQ